MGFKTMYFLFNVGSVILWTVAFFVLCLISLLLKPLRKFKCCNWLYCQITKRIFWNFPITSFSETYQFIAMCTAVNTLNVSALPCNLL